MAAATVWCVATAVLALAVSSHVAQAQGGARPSPQEAAALLQSRPDLVAQLRDRIATSGMSPDQVRARLKAEGYEIKKFKITKGNCYEIYGWDKQRVKVEIYFDPVTGKAVKTETG
jgi:hypothetical protein